MNTPVKAQDIQRAAHDLGIARSPLEIHASLRSFGDVEGGAETVLNGLLAEGCTVLVPTFASFEIAPPDEPAMRPARNATDYTDIPPFPPGAGRVYTPASNEIDRKAMGAIPAAVLAMPGRVRGNHPLNSFAAVGPLAHALMDGQEPLDVYRPLEALVERDGWVVLMGTALTSMTILHLAEQRAGRTLFRRWANDGTGRPMMVEVGNCSRGFTNFEPLLAPLARELIAGKSRWRAFPARETVQVATDAILQDPSITRCNNPECRRCPDAILGGPVLP